MMPPHEHKSLHEFFYVLEGKGIIQVNGVDHHVEPGWVSNFIIDTVIRWLIILNPFHQTQKVPSHGAF